MTEEELEKKAEEWCINADNLGLEFFGSVKDVVREAYIAGAKENSVVWHDLRKNPNDLPPEDKDYEGISIDVLSEKGKAVNYSFEDKKWSDCHSLMFTDVLARCEIPRWEPEPTN